MTRRFARFAVVLAAAGCAPVPHPGAASFPPALSGLGTEPFWSVEIEGARLSYATAEEPTPIGAEIVRRESHGLLELTGTLAGRTLHAFVRRAPCSDGLSDRTYPFTLELTLGDRALRGCAYPRGKSLNGGSAPQNRH